MEAKQIFLNLQTIISNVAENNYFKTVITALLVLISVRYLILYAPAFFYFGLKTYRKIDWRMRSSALEDQDLVLTKKLIARHEYFKEKSQILLIEVNNEISFYSQNIPEIVYLKPHRFALVYGSNLLDDYSTSRMDQLFQKMINGLKDVKKKHLIWMILNTVLITLLEALDRIMYEIMTKLINFFKNKSHLQEIVFFCVVLFLAPLRFILLQLQNFVREKFWQVFDIQLKNELDTLCFEQQQKFKVSFFQEIVRFYKMLQLKATHRVLKC